MIKFFNFFRGNLQRFKKKSYLDEKYGIKSLILCISFQKSWKAVVV